MTFSFPAGYDVEKTAANAFAKASFGGGVPGPGAVEFAYSELTVKGGIRHALHEFPHSPGAEVEKMGRKAYVITFTCTFHRVPGSELDKQYPELYPTRLRQLREMFEKEITAELVVPTIGTIKAVATSWTQTKRAQETTGEEVSLEFVEDQDTTRAFDDQTSDYGMSKMAEANDALLAAAALADFKKQNAIGFFQQLNDAITAVQGFFGQADAMSRLVEGKIRALDQLISWGDAQVDELQNPTNYLVVNALHDLWGSVRAMQENIVEAREEIRLYKVPRKMSVNQISTAIYGSSERGFELMQLNDFKDTLEVQAGTDVRYLHKELVLFGQKTGLSTSLNV